MFAYTPFNQDISKWDVSCVIRMDAMFFKSKFNQDISRWDVSRVRDMRDMFRKSCFNQDIPDWQPKALTNKDNIFKDSQLEKESRLPYWANIEVEILDRAILAYGLQKQLGRKLALQQINGSSPILTLKI